MHARVRSRVRSRRPARADVLVVALESILLVALVGAVLAVGRVGTGGPVDPGTPPAATPGATPTPAPTPTPTPTPTAPPTPTPSPAPTPTPAPTPAPTPTPSPQRPPACFYGDLPTAHDRYSDWSITLLDTIYRLPSTYHPNDLVDTGRAGLNGGYRVRSIVIGDLAALAAAARAAGAPIEIVSAFRSYATQRETFEHWVRVGGYAEALRTSARPGHSEHQLGTVIDVSTPGGPRPWEYRDWADTAAGAWMAENAWRYGFVMSYPHGSFAQTCYDYEPWHYRYVGRELAAAIRASGLTPREYLWRIQ